MSVRSRQDRREEAGVRDEERAQRTAAQQLNKITQAGHGHCKEAKRLRDAMKEEKA